MQVKIAEKDGYKRIDNEFVNIEVNVLRTLKEISITDSTTILVDTKNINELKEQFPDEYSPVKEGGDEPAEGSIYNQRSCIVTTEEDPDNEITMSIDISSHTMQSFTDYLKTHFDLEGDYRIRNLSNRGFYSTEDLEKKLNEFDEFQESGVCINLESGNYCSKTEKCVKVYLY